MSRDIVTKACYSCGRVESGLTIGLNDGSRIELCAHCAIKGIREISEHSTLTRWPIGMEVLHAIDTIDDNTITAIYEAMQMDADMVAECLFYLIMKGYATTKDERVEITEEGRRRLEQTRRCAP